MSHSQKTYGVRRLPRNEKLVIDGYGRDKAWKLAGMLEDFTFPWIDDSPPRTIFRSLWNGENFYFLFDVSDADLVLADGIEVKERVIGSDRVEIFISSGPKLSPYYGLEMDPRGEVLSYSARFHHKIDWDWTCNGLRVLATQKSDGYTVEGSIPIETLQHLGCLHENYDGRYLIAGLFRGEFSNGEDGHRIENWMTWVDPKVKSPDFHVPSAFGILKLLRSP